VTPTPTIANIYDPSQRRALSAQETRAMDPAYRRANPVMSTLQEPRLAPVPRSLPYYAGEMLSSGPAQGMGRLLFNNGAIPGALGTGALGYGGGKLADWILGLMGHETNIAPWAGLLGAAGGGLLGHMRHMRAPYVQKSAATWSAGTWADRNAMTAEIMQRVAGSPGLSPMDRINMRAELEGLATSQLSVIWNKIKDMAPFAIGAFLSRILFGTGAIGSLAAGALTQGLANQFGGRNSAGVPFASIM